MFCLFFSQLHWSDPKKKTLFVTSIFKWYSENFDDDIVGFLEKYAEGGLKTRLPMHPGGIEVVCPDYDWSLSGK